MKKTISKSGLTVIVSSLVIIIFRFIIPPESILSWDVFGYYLYLPAKFIYGNLSLSDQSWLSQLLDTYEPTSTLYQAQLLENGNWVIKYTMGLSILYSPFFLIGHVIALISGFPADGLSLPYQYSLTFGGILFAIIGLVYLRKILKTFFNDSISSIVLIIIVAGTNYFQLITFDGTLLSHNFLFTLYALLVWNTISWHQNPRLRGAIIIGAICGFIILIRPSEAVCILIPMLWNIHDKKSWSEKGTFMKANYTHILSAILSSIIVCLPQIFYWKIITGSWLYYSYTNPGEGFEFLHPYTLPFLFSFRKGWLIYTPVIIFALVGFIQLFRLNKELFLATSSFLILSIYIISSWSCWWYAGATYSSRSMVPAYVILALPLGYFINWVSGKRLRNIIFVGMIALFMVLNLFQTWQFEKGIIPRDGVTMDYYFAAFGKTNTTPEMKKLLMVERSADAVEHFSDQANYSKKTLAYFAFEGISDTGSIHHSGKGALRMDSLTQYSPGTDITFKEITTKDHAWIRASVWMYIPEGYNEELPVLVLTFNHEGKPYKYRTSDLSNVSLGSNQWKYVSIDYLTPEVRSVDDNLKAYIWHRGKQHIFIDDFEVIAYEPYK